jgi:hypothetical protein
MAKRNRASLLKRQREADKRERQAKRAAKAAVKRERRVGKRNARSEIATGEDVHGDAAPAGLPKGPADVDRDAPRATPGASEHGTPAQESRR